MNIHNKSVMNELALITPNLPEQLQSYGPILTTVTEKLYYHLMMDSPYKPGKLRVVLTLHRIIKETTKYEPESISCYVPKFLVTPGEKLYGDFIYKVYFPLVVTGSGSGSNFLIRIDTGSCGVTKTSKYYLKNIAARVTLLDLLNNWRKHPMDRHRRFEKILTQMYCDRAGLTNHPENWPIEMSQE